MNDTTRLRAAGRLAAAFVNSKLTPLFVVASILLGVFAVVKLPREEEPQIIVPMIDVFVEMPGASAREVEERVTKPMEKLLWEIPGVEYIYSTSSPGGSMAVVRFFVGEDEEKAIVRLNQKMFANFDLIPPGASPPLIKPRSIDDVPILALTLWSKRYGDYELRRLAAQLHDTIKQVDQVSAVAIIGGQRRQVRVDLDEARLAGYHLSPSDVAGALGAANRRLPAGSFSSANREFVLETGSFLACADDVRRVVVGVADNRPVFLGDVARIEDGGEEPSQYVRYASAGDPAFWPAVTLAVSKRKGANAIAVADRVLARVDAVRGSLLPSDVQLSITRNYGETAAEKSNELLFHMLIAVISVAALDLAHARLARSRHRLHRDSRDAGAHAHHLLPLRLHAEPHHAVRADLLHRHPGGRRDRGCREHRAPLRACRTTRAAAWRRWRSKQSMKSAIRPSSPL